MKEGIVFIAPLGARDKKAVIFKEIVSQCSGSDYSSVLYITPSAFGQREAGRQFFSYQKSSPGKKVYIPFRSLSLKNLCGDLYEAYGKEYIISDCIKPLVLCEILGKKNIGHAYLLSELMSKIRHYIFDKELGPLKEDIKSHIFEEKTMDRAVRSIGILEAYEKELKEKGLIDFDGAVRQSIPFVREHISPPVLVLDGFFDPTPLELEVIKALIERSDKVYALVEEGAEFLKFFVSCETKFREKRLKSFHRREAAGYYPCSSMENEVAGIAKGVKGLILEGVRPNQITVSFPVLHKYLPMLKRIFQKHGIPTSIAEYRLSHSKPVVAMEEMIISIEEDYPRDEFLSFLISAYFPGIPEILKEWAVYFSIRAGIVKGKKAWLCIKETLLNSADEVISADEKEILDEFQLKIKQTINILEKLKQQKVISSFIDELESILNMFGFFGVKLRERPDFSGGDSAVHYRDDITREMDRLFFELRQFTKLYDIAEDGIETMGFYLRQMLKGLKGSDENIDGVRVVPFELAAGLESRAIFFGGMVENDLPSRPDIDPILPERVKKTLGLPFLEYYLDRQKRYFKRILNVSSHDPYFSCPMADGDKIFLPSPFLDWERSLNSPVLNISTEEEILVRKGAFKQRDFSEMLWAGISFRIDPDDSYRAGELPRGKKIKDILLQTFGPKIFFRVTDIDVYRQCPLRFYIERFLCLEREKAPKFEVEARLWGRLAHKTMEYLYKDGDIKLKDIDKRLFKGLEKSLNEFPIGDFWSKVAREIFQGLLPRLKEQETDIRLKGFIPYMVEMPIKARINSLGIKGKIDRIDRRQLSTVNCQQSSVILFDYKTGAIDRDSLQLPLYACMWQKENAESAEKAGFYSLKDGSIEWYPKKEDMEEYMNNALMNTEEIVRHMRKGIFEPVPFKHGQCRYCDHSALCREAK
ncbi:MAG: PD-(D/E)XK nuclease family protein [Candidatus Mariimomonas ferrooxydans]